MFKWILQIVLMLMLPFVALIRASLWLHQHYSLSAWMALAAGVALTSLLLIGYAYWGARRLGRRLNGNLAKVLFLLVILYTGFTLLYISPANVKTARVASTYQELHPLLRVTLSTFILWMATWC